MVIHRLVMQWQPAIEHMPSAKRIIMKWNNSIVDHEEQHIKDVQKLAEQMLPEEKTYVGQGEDENDAENDILGQVAHDDLQIEIAFLQAIKANDDKFHTTLDKGMKLPSLCKGT